MQLRILTPAKTITYEKSHFVLNHYVRDSGTGHLVHDEERGDERDEHRRYHDSRRDDDKEDHRQEEGGRDSGGIGFAIRVAEEEESGGEEGRRIAVTIRERVASGVADSIIAA
jgi:hypothetical protein